MKILNGEPYPDTVLTATDSRTFQIKYIPRYASFMRLEEGSFVFMMHYGTCDHGAADKAFSSMFNWT